MPAPFPLASRLALAALALTAGCERIVSVTVPAEPPRLVVEARLESPRSGAAEVPRVRLTTTQPYFDNQAAPAATGATVHLVVGSAAPLTLTEQAPGDFSGPALVVQPGTVYALEIRWRGDVYVAVDTAADVAPIDSLYAALPAPGRPGLRTGLRATVDFQDPPVVENRYLWDQWIDDVRLPGPDSTTFGRVVANDLGLNGRTVEGWVPFAGYAVRPGATVRVRQRGISSAVFDWFIALNEQVANDGSPFALPSTSVRSLIRNRTTPTRRPSGYFSVGRYDERTLVVSATP